MKDKAYKGYRYEVSEEKIRHWLSLTPEQRLEWLEEINIFIHSYAPQKAKKIIAMFRKGEI